MPQPLIIYRRDSTDTQLAIGATATDTPLTVPCLGYANVRVHMRAPTDAITLTLNQRMQSGSTNVAMNTFTLSAAGALSQTVAIRGELLGLALVNGPTAQTPEVLVEMI